MAVIVITYERRASIEALNRASLDVEGQIRRTAYMHMLDECLRAEAHFNTEKIRGLHVWKDHRGNPCPEPVAVYRDFRYQMLATERSAR